MQHNVDSNETLLYNFIKLKKQHIVANGGEINETISKSNYSLKKKAW